MKKLFISSKATIKVKLALFSLLCFFAVLFTRAGVPDGCRAYCEASSTSMCYITANGDVYVSPGRVVIICDQSE